MTNSNLASKNLTDLYKVIVEKDEIIAYQREEIIKLKELLTTNHENKFPLCFRLPYREYKTLDLLVQNHGRFIMVNFIAEYVWQDLANGLGNYSRVGVTIFNLRRKLKKYNLVIQNKTNFGYCFPSNLVTVLEKIKQDHAECSEVCHIL